MMRAGRTERNGRPSRSAGPAGGGGGGTVSLAAAIEALEPLGWWKMDEASGTLANSGSASGDGTAVGSPTYRSAAGPDGNSYLAAGSGQYVSIPSSALLNLTTSKTACIAWRPTSNAGLNGLFAKGSADREMQLYDATGTGGWQVTVYQNASVSAHRRLDASPVLGAPALNTWHFAVATFNKSANPKLWLDDTTPVPGTPSGPTGTVEAGSTDILTWGAWAAFPTTYYTVGAIAHCALFEGVMADADAEALMAAAIAEGWVPA